jgi:hypothetical protein
MGSEATPASHEQWKAHLPMVYSHLGVQHDLSSREIVNVFVAISDLDNGRSVILNES